MTSLGTALGRAARLAGDLIRAARRGGLEASSIVAAGGVRRFEPEVSGLALLAVAPPDSVTSVLDSFARLDLVMAVGERTPSSVTVATERGPLTLHVAPPEQAGAALVWHTGSRRHTARLQVCAQARGLRFDQGRLARAGGGPVDCPTEAAFYRRLGLSYIPPELREDTGEIEAAGDRTLPPLVSVRHIRGDLHTHTCWSDGRDPVEAMVRAAKQRGYAYVAITDHSERARASRTLRADDVARQADEVAAARVRVGGIDVLHGIEVDIMPDGSLDFPDALLERFDIVLASLHEPAGQDAARLAERYLQAIRHPLVNVITHPANRTPGYRRGYDLDFDRLFAAAAETGTAVEIDGGPGHLDLDGALARRAAAAGVTLTIDSDGHRTDTLARQMRFGLGTARRGWVEARHVLNARPLAEVLAFIAAKRAGRPAGTAAAGGLAAATGWLPGE